MSVVSQVSRLQHPTDARLEESATCDASKRRQRRGSRWMLHALYLMLSVAVVLAVLCTLWRLEQSTINSMSQSQPASSQSMSVDSLLAAAANRQQHVRQRNPTAPPNHLTQAARPSGTKHNNRAAVPEAQPAAVQWRLLDADYKPLPWRALQHLRQVPQPSPLASNSSLKQAHAPAYLVSAYLDTRRMLKGKPPRVAVILEVDKEANSQDWGCLLSLSNPAVLSHNSQRYYSKLSVPYSVPNNEQFFQYQPATGFCEIPGDLDLSRLFTKDSTDSSLGQQSRMMGHGLPQQQQQLFVTVVGATTASHAHMPRHMLNWPWEFTGADSTASNRRIAAESWVQLEVIPPLESAADYANSVEGSIAVCTPPLHTDAYAATLVEWAEFARLMGASKVFTYSFNPGPLIKPLIDYYQSTGYFEVHEWIIPRSILRDPTQQCKLPFFHRPSNLELYDSPSCTFHQDNYNTAWWGQVAAVQDCVYRAMSQAHRWVVITDFDEYIVPQKASVPDWPTMLQELSKLNTGSRPAVQYQFEGVRVCSGCTRPLQPYMQSSGNAKSSLHNSSSALPSLPSRRRLRTAHNGIAKVRRAPAIGLPDTCVHPSVGFDHILWSAVVYTTTDHVKCIVDPLAVGQASVHGTPHFSPESVAAGVVTAPSDIALKLHDRVHDIHKATTFATIMLPLLLKHVQGDVSPGVECSTGIASSKVPVQGASWAAWPQSAEVLCNSCDGPKAGMDLPTHVEVNYGLCNLHGRSLSGGVATAVQNMWQAGVFDVWQNMSLSAGSVYGGHVFDKWAPPP